MLGKRVAKYCKTDKTLHLGTVASVDKDKSCRWDKIQYMIQWDDTTYSSLTQNEVCISIHDFKNQTTRFDFKRNKQAKIPKDGIFHSVNLKIPPVKKFKIIDDGKICCPRKERFHHCNMVQIKTKAEFTKFGLHNECCYLAFDKTCVLKDDYSDQFAG